MQSELQLHIHTYTLTLSISETLCCGSLWSTSITALTSLEAVLITRGAVKPNLFKAYLVSSLASPKATASVS